MEDTARLIKPTLCIVAGPNGSGKTTTTESLLQHQWASDSLYINPDNIAQERFGGWNDPASILEAARYATSLRYDCLRDKRSFVFETVFSSEEKLQFLLKAKEAGYFVRLFFVCTDDPGINAMRITARYLMGGHEVPISKIVSRYYKSIANLIRSIPLADRIYVYDNTAEGKTPLLLFRISDGLIQRQYQPHIPTWATTIYEAATRQV